jgi:transcriptional regulator with XRE-family HTH domain
MIEQYANLIRERRFQLGLSLKRLAAKANCGLISITTLEDKRRLPPPETLYRICGALGLNPTTTEERG